MSVSKYVRCNVVLAFATSAELNQSDLRECWTSSWLGVGIVPSQLGTAAGLTDTPCLNGITLLLTQTLSIAILIRVQACHSCDSRVNTRCRMS